MNATKTSKLWAVASHPSTNDNEASNAFAMFRRSLPNEQNVESFLKDHLRVSSTESNSDLAIKYHQLRERYDSAQRSHGEEVNIIKAEHRKVLERAARRLSDVEAILHSKEEELSQIKANGPDDELGIIAQRNVEIERLAAKLKAESEAVKQAANSREQYAADKVAAAERAIMEKLSSMFGSSADPQPEACAKPESKPSRTKSAASAKERKSPRAKAYRVNRKGAETESIVASLLTNEWKSVSALFDGARRYGFTGVENAIRFAAERLVRTGNAEQGFDYKRHIAFRRA